ncbi:hypothetical protein [Candidatus Arsenophonus triatominarum]|uniref:hypothetical protein n=1 Tax=Candidatus Arsenophonus triatominarum TaxID=57911 RepID=UPI0007C4C006|nr:hypothetical protein [Candidatus Arsenophonus triatominarum]
MLKYPYGFDSFTNFLAKCGLGEIELISKGYCFCYLLPQGVSIYLYKNGTILIQGNLAIKHAIEMTIKELLQKTS